MSKSSDAALLRSWDAGAAFQEGARTVPLYRQIYLILRDKILGGVFPNGSLLPSEHDLARLFGVSRITAKRVLNEIAAEGLCVRRRGRGSEVSYQPSKGPLESDVQGLLDRLFQMNLETDGAVLEFEYLPAGPEIAVEMRIPEGESVQRSVRLRKLAGTPFSHLTTYIPADLGIAFDREHLARQAALTLLEKSGVQVANADQTLTATLAEQAVADTLELPPGAPLLRITRSVYDVAGRVVEYFVGLYRPDQFQYRMTLSRVARDGTRAWATVHPPSRP